MSKSAPIGVFDSGVGGLSVLTELREVLPKEDLLYLADEAHCPYGTKSIPEINQRVLEVTNFLISEGVKTIVVACNSASVAGLDAIRAVYPELPITGVEPAVKMAQNVTRNGRVGVLATQLTLNGSRFSSLVEKYGTELQLYKQPAPGLVELVEDGQMATPEAETLLRQYLQPLLDKQIDTLVLGCTHFPFLKQQISAICGPEVTVLDTGAPVARQVAKVLRDRDLLNDQSRSGQDLFYTSGQPERVTKTIRLLWRNDSVEVQKVNF